MRNPFAAFLAAVAVLLPCACAMPPGAVPDSAPGLVDAAIPPGLGEQTAVLGETRLRVFTYRPEGCRIGGALLVFAGLRRNAGEYRDDARPLGQRLCMIVVAPLFDEGRFDTARYQRGGLLEGGALRPRAAWTISLVPLLEGWVRARENDGALPVAMIGHSAGAQFLSRVAAYLPSSATRLVVADPSTWVWPDLAVAVPYGMGGVYAPGQAEEELRRYLAAPITVLLGGDDVGARNLATSRQARQQGGTRLDRGENAFEAGRAMAQQRGWAFNWRLMIAPGIAHDARLLFGSDTALEALRP